MVASILLGLIGSFVAVIGMKCMKCMEDDEVRKMRMAVFGGILFLISGESWVLAGPQLPLAWGPCRDPTGQGRVSPSGEGAAVLCACPWPGPGLLRSRLGLIGGGGRRVGPTGTSGRWPESLVGAGWAWLPVSGAPRGPFAFFRKQLRGTPLGPGLWQGCTVLGGHPLHPS